MDRAVKLISRLSLPKGCVTPEELARAAWPQAVGRRIASRARAVALADSTLIVEVEDEVWQGQLSTLRSQILARLKEVLGKEIVADMDLRVRIPRRLPQRAEQAQLSPDEAERIEDPVLRRLYKLSRKRSLA
jgi:predicted nucleic acid-binding Zn ribbon protein